MATHIIIVNKHVVQTRLVYQLLHLCIDQAVRQGGPQASPYHHYGLGDSANVSPDGGCGRHPFQPRSGSTSSFHAHRAIVSRHPVWNYELLYPLLSVVFPFVCVLREFISYNIILLCERSNILRSSCLAHVVNRCRCLFAHCTRHIQMMSDVYHGLVMDPRLPVVVTMVLSICGMAVRLS
jgi:hypothetical protein